MSRHQVWFCTYYDEIHLVMKVNKHLGATLIEWSFQDEWVPITFPREHLGWFFVGYF